MEEEEVKKFEIWMLGCRWKVYLKSKKEKIEKVDLLVDHSHKFFGRIEAKTFNKGNGPSYFSDYPIHFARLFDA